MKSTLKFRSALLGLAAFSMCLTSTAAQSNRWQHTPTFSTDPKDSDLCQRQMNHIYTAIQQYHKKHQQFPRQLSVLVPDFLHNPEDLVCPYVNRTGDLTGWRLHVDQTVFDDAGTSYAYEFSDKPSRWATTARELKENHMKFFGFGVPIVRCFAHRPRLNLAYGGTVFQSDFEWEDAYLPCTHQQALFHATLTDTNPVATNFLAALRPPRAWMDLTPLQLDLSAHYNAPVFHLSRMDRRGQLLMTHPRSAECVAGVLFDIRALIHLGGELFPISFPKQVDGIRVDAQSSRLHFLHGTVQSPLVSQASFAPGPTNAVYSIRFADGAVEEIPILYGRDVKALWFNPDEVPAPGEAKAAWVCAVPGTKTALRLYRTTWQNPHPDRLIESVGVRSHATHCAPFLVAITLDSPP